MLGNMVGDQPEGPLSNLTDVQGFSHAGRSTLATYHETYPNKPLFLSECCSCNTQRGENWATESVNPAFNANCLASQTNASQGVPWVAGAMVWTLFGKSTPLVLRLLKRFQSSGPVHLLGGTH